MLSSCNKHKAKITGQIKNVQDKSVLYLSRLEPGNIVRIDSVVLDNSGKFSFKVEANEPTYYTLTLNGSIITLLVDESEKAELECDAQKFGSSYTVKGSEGSSQVLFLNSKLFETQTVIDSIRTAYDALGDDAQSEKQRLESRMNEVVKQQRKTSIKFIIEHLSSMSSILAIYQEIEKGVYVLNSNRDLQYVKLVSDSLHKYYPQSNQVKAMWTDRQRLLSKYNEMRLLSMAKRKDAGFPDIQLPNVNGDTLALSANLGKVILLSFWSVNNQESRTLNIDIRELYQKYSSKGFEVYQVSFDANVNSWKSAIQQLNIPWKSVNDAMGAQSRYIRMYNLQQIPSIFLINRDGQIVARDVSGTQLYKSVESLFR
jgi:peroxiredoxin